MFTPFKKAPTLIDLYSVRKLQNVSVLKINDNDVFLSCLINPILLGLDTPISIVALHQSSCFFPPYQAAMLRERDGIADRRLPPYYFGSHYDLNVFFGLYKYKTGE